MSIRRPMPTGERGPSVTGLVMPTDPGLAAQLARQQLANREDIRTNMAQRQGSATDLARMRLGMLQDAMRQVNGHSVAARRVMGF